MKDTVNILGVSVDMVSMDEAVARCRDFIKKGGAVFTPNPEIIMRAYREPDFLKLFYEADMVVPDGIGVVMASKTLGKPVKERVAGYDLVVNMLKYCAENNISVYILGGKPGVAAKAGEMITDKFKVHVCGAEHGYHKDYTLVIEDIKSKKPGLLLVCLGAPLQEKWIAENKGKIPPCLMIGAGGSVDVLAGTVKRAPELFIKLNLEWFYRLVTQPSRFFRMLDLPKFMLTVLLKGERQRRKEK
jgi:N-acetylglucosaminyldiphosphoundecaprenol N-acetyl-beta-D-mannosaminyltransferase